MANIEYKIKDVQFSFDPAKLTPESVAKALLKAASRITAERYTGKGEKTPSTEDLKKKAAEFAADPNLIFAGAVREGVPRPKKDMYERAAGSWFTSQLFPAVKLGNEKAVALWKKAGGDGVVIKASAEATEAIKAAVQKNQAARDKLVAAKAKKLKDSGWEPDLS